LDGKCHSSILFHPNDGFVYYWNDEMNKCIIATAAVTLLVISALLLLTVHGCSSSNNNTPKPVHGCSSSNNNTPKPKPKLVEARYKLRVYKSVDHITSIQIDWIAKTNFYTTTSLQPDEVTAYIKKLEALVEDLKRTEAEMYEKGILKQIPSKPVIDYGPNGEPNNG